MWSDTQRDVMRRAIASARLGRPSPNPHVGAAIVVGDEIVALGWHRKAGEAHAEVDAIDKAGPRARGSTLYVTLEPCNHQGRTGPCTEAIIEAGIVKVIVGCPDPTLHATGGVDRLREAGIVVEMGLLRDEATALVADFAKHFKTGLPYVTLKAAITLDGKMATRTGDSKWITGEEARTEAHRLRDRNDAVLVGVGTVLADDPQLTVRHVEGRDPIRVVLDADLRTPPEALIVTQTSRAPTWIFHANDVAEARREPLQWPGVELIPVDRSPRGVALHDVLRILGERDIVRLLVEGGAHVHGSFLDMALADRAALFVAPRLVGDARAISFGAGMGVESIDETVRLVHTEITTLGTDWLISGDFEREH